MHVPVRRGGDAGNHASWGIRQGIHLLAAAILWVSVLTPAWASGAATLPATNLIWEAPQGIGASAAAAGWRADLAGDVTAAKAWCPDAALPTLDPTLPSIAFRIPVSPTRPVVYTKDAVVGRLLVIARDEHGCLWSASSGRNQPFQERWLLSPLANLRLPPGAPAQEATAIIQDGKTLRPWLRVARTDDFVRDSIRLWVLLGGYTGVLGVLLIIGVGLRLSYPSPLTNAYVFYIVTMLVYQLQVLGIGPAWVPGWPQGDSFAVMQGVAAGSVVAGLGMAMTTFLRPSGRLRLTIIGGVTLATAAYLASGWYAPSYRIASLIMLSLAPAVLFMVARGLKNNEPWVRWFAVGLSATILGGGAQTATVVFNGAGLGALGSFAFPLGNLIESVCWLIALLVRLGAERLRAQERLIYDATHDALTKLPNRGYLTERFVPNRSANVGTDSARECCRGLVLIDLDRFKAINDSLGYGTGDDLLVAVARLLCTLAPPGATVAHLGADTFAVLLHGENRTEGAQEVAIRVTERLREPVALPGGSVHVRASIGVVNAPAPNASFIEILRDADSALNLAKVGGGNRHVNFQPVMRAPALRRFHLEQDLGEALRDGVFEVHFQPIVALADRRPVGMEALIRWPHPTQGWLSPTDFIQVAEETGLIVRLGAWVLARTAHQIQDWRRRGCWRSGFYVSVNLSGNQLLDGNLLEHVDTVIADYGLLPGELRLELTETAVMTNIEVASGLLPALRERQIPLCMDDFGTGYSSLSYLNELPFDVLKIDRSFVSGIETREPSQFLVRTVLAMAQSMGLQVIAEGVESEEQATLLWSMGCPYGQGYHFSQALPAAQAEAWLG
jgi:diguanylate cyclase (GGDEF)-like protein